MLRIAFVGLKLNNVGIETCLAVLELVNKKSIYPVTDKKLFEDKHGSPSNLQSLDYIFPAKD